MCETLPLLFKELGLNFGSPFSSHFIFFWFSPGFLGPSHEKFERKDIAFFTYAYRSTNFPAVSLKNHKGISSGLFVLKAWSSRNTSRGSSKCTERTLVTTIVKMKSPLWSLLPCVSIEGPIQILGKSTHPGSGCLASLTFQYIWASKWYSYLTVILQIQNYMNKKLLLCTRERGLGKQWEQYHTIADHPLQSFTYLQKYFSVQY